MSRLSRVGKITGLLFVVLIVLLGSSLTVSFASGANSIHSTGYYVVAHSSGAIDATTTWNVPKASACNTKNYIGIAVGFETGGHKDGLYTKISCSGAGASPVYSQYGMYKGTTFPISSLSHTIAPGDKLSYGVDFTITHSLKITFADITRGWTYSSTGLTDTVTPSGQQLYWFLLGPANFLPLKFSKLTFSGITATLGGHTGSLGSFSGSSLYSLNYVSSYVDSTNGHTLAMSSPLSTLGNSFSITFLRNN